jgi:Heavy metal binding domain
MRVLKLSTGLLAAALLLSGSTVYSVPVVSAAQKEHSAHPKKPLKFHYVCPMHEDITSQQRGACPKCKMKLVKKPVPQEPAQ